MKRFYLLFLMLYCCALQQLFAIYFTRIGIQDGLPQISVLSICQDALGRMWFSTEEGVCYYDGVKITVLKYLKETEADSIQIGNKTQFTPFRRLLKFAQPVYDLRLFQGADPL